MTGTLLDLRENPRPPAPALARLSAALAFRAVRLVLCDDYVDARIDAVNRQSLDDRIPLLLAKPTGPIIWAGPLLIPGATACWDCLRHAIVRNRWRDHAAWRSGESVPVTVSEITAEAETELWRSIEHEVVSFEDMKVSPLLGNLFTIDPKCGQSSRHPVVRRVECRSCCGLGRPSLWSVSPASTPISEKLMAHYSGLTGFLSNLSQVSDDGWMPVRVMACECALPLDPRIPLLGDPPEPCAGRGLDVHNASLRCLAEGAERYSMFIQGEERVTKERYANLGERAINPQQLVLTSDSQYSESEDGRWYAQVGDYRWIRFDPLHPIDWVEATELSTADTRLVPAACVYLRHLEPQHPFFAADSSGCAAGSDIESATISAILELVEREALGIWWYHRLVRPRIPWNRFRGTWLEAAPSAFSIHDREVWLLDLSHDWGLPVVAAACARPDGAYPAFATACALDLESAASSAVTELIQTHIAMGFSSTGDCELISSSLWRHVDEHRFVRGAEGVWSQMHPPLEPTLKFLIDRAGSLGLSLYRVDLSRPSIGVPVVRILAPSMASKRAAFGPGRLHHVPVQLGWIDDQAGLASDLNAPLR